MKKGTTFLLTFGLFCLFTVITSASALKLSETDSCGITEINLISIFPESLEIIEESAFEGTSIAHIFLPKRLEKIEESAFSNIKTLRLVQIPYGTDYIAKNAFDGSRNVSIISAPGSYAKAFAKSNGIPFSPIAHICAENGKSGFKKLIESKPEIILHPVTSDNNLKASKKNRETREKISKYKTASHINNKGPPLA